MPRKEERPLDPVYQDAESIFAGRRGAIQQAAINTGAQKKWAEVLCWYLENHADEREIVADATAIAGSYWLNVSTRTVQRANAHWREHGALTFRQRWDKNGGSLSPWASLKWSTILRLACVQSAGTNPEISTRERATESRCIPSDCNGSFFATGGDATTTPCQSGGDMSPPGYDMSPPGYDMSPPPASRPYTDSGDSPCSSLALAWRSRAVLLACVRARVVVSSVVVVVDDNNNRKEASREEIAELAAKAGRLIWSQVPHTAWGSLYAAAAAAKLLLGEPCLIRAAETMGQRLRDPSLPRVTRPVNFFIGTLRNHLNSIAGIEAFSSPEEAKTWISAFLFPLEEATASWLPPPPVRAAESIRVASPAEPSAEEREAAARRLKEGRDAKLNRVRGKPGDEARHDGQL